LAQFHYLLHPGEESLILSWRLGRNCRHYVTIVSVIYVQGSASTDSISVRQRIGPGGPDAVSSREVGENRGFGEQKNGRKRRFLLMHLKMRPVLTMLRPTQGA
jgi:hypothetical protein